MKKFELLFTPEHDQAPTVADAIAAAKQQQGKEVINYHHYLPNPFGAIEIRSLPPKHPQAYSGAFMLTVCPPDAIGGYGSFSSFLGARGVEALLPGVQCAAQAFLQLEDPQALTVALKNFTVIRTTMEFFFEAETEAQATQLLLGLAQHCKVVLDFSAPMPNKKWAYPKKTLTHVSWSRDSGQVLEIALPFANIRAFIVTGNRSLPHEFLDSADEAERAEKLSYLRRLICIEIDADMALVTEGTDPSFRLPLQFDKWAPRAMNRNPYEFVWDAFAWETKLNLDLPSSEADIDFAAAGLSEEQEDLLRGYFSGASMRSHPAINDDHGRFLAFRRALIQKANIDLLNPWRFFRWNSATILRPILSFGNQLKGANSPFLTDFTLTMEKAAEAASALEAALKDATGRGNWR